MPADLFPRRVSAVVEFAFREGITLPAGTELFKSGEWMHVLD
jgi:hypothetical protein